jgi:hypothetical protein
MFARLLLLAGLLVAAGSVAVAPVAFAQPSPAAVARATIQSASPDGSSLSVKTHAGETQTVHIGAKTRFILVVPASLDAIKPGAFIGVAAVPGDGDTLKALEVHIFPEVMRGTGEGFRAFDLAPNSSMTNGNVDVRVDGVEGPKLTVSYKGGKQTVILPPGVPVVGFAPASAADLKPGASIIARGMKAEDGSLAAGVVLVGKDGLVPPM